MTSAFQMSFQIQVALAAALIRNDLATEAIPSAPLAFLSGPRRKYGDVSGEEFSVQARREEGAYPQRSVTDEQRSLRRKEPPGTSPYLRLGPLSCPFSFSCIFAPFSWPTLSYPFSPVAPCSSRRFPFASISV